MDITSPQLMWINGRCYRVNPQIDDEAEDSNTSETKGYIEEDLYGDDDYEEDGEDSYDVSMLGKDRFKTIFHVPSLFYALIIGQKGITKKRIETETKTMIKIPKQGAAESDIEIVGTSRQSVCSARRRVELIALGARHKQEFTHFLCIPITNTTIKENFIKFKNDILKNGISLVDEKLFQNPDKMHLTLCTLSLMDNADRVLAARLLQDTKDTIIKPIMDQYSPLDIKMTGVEYMNDDPSAVDVLYGKVECEPLQQMANQIVDRFVNKGLIQRQHDNVKLHVTLINSLFGVNSYDSNPTKRETFDACAILQKFTRYEFGKQSLKEIHLSRRHTTSCDGFYEATGILKVK